MREPKREREPSHATSQSPGNTRNTIYAVYSWSEKEKKKRKELKKMKSNKRGRRRWERERGAYVHIGGRSPNIQKTDIPIRIEEEEHRYCGNRGPSSIPQPSHSKALTVE